MQFDCALPDTPQEAREWGDVCEESVKNAINHCSNEFPASVKEKTQLQLQEMKELRERTVPHLEAFMLSLPNKLLNSTKANFKTDESALAKADRPAILADKPWHRFVHLRDFYRMKTVPESLEDIVAIVQTVLDSPDFFIIKMDMDKLKSPKKMFGWRICSVDILSRHTGMLVEYYFPLLQLERTKKIHL